MKKIFILSILLGLFGIVNAAQTTSAFNEETLQVLSHHELEKLQKVVAELKNDADVALAIKQLKEQFELKEDVDTFFGTSISYVLGALIIGVGVIMPWVLVSGQLDPYLCGSSE